MAHEDWGLENWKLNKNNVTNDFAEHTMAVDVNTENKEDGVWIELAGGVNRQTFYTWVSADVAEAMGTLLMYAAKDWRDKHEPTAS